MIWNSWLVITVFSVLVFHAHKVLVRRQKPNHSACSLISAPFHRLSQKVRRITAGWCLRCRALGAAVCVCWSMLIKNSNLKNNNKEGRIVFLPPVEWRPEGRREVLASGGVVVTEGLWLPLWCNCYNGRPGNCSGSVKRSSNFSLWFFLRLQQELEHPHVQMCHDWECVSDDFVSSVGCDRLQGAREEGRLLPETRKVVEEGRGEL